MRIIGIDPGYAIVGYGILDCAASKFRTLDYGVITTSAKTPLEDRLEIIYNRLDLLIKKYKPDVISVEELFFHTNLKTAISVAQARGVILLCAKKNGVEIFEYTPLQVKQAVVGYGRAEKNQVIAMTSALLGLDKPPKPDDAADALAVAICHGHTGGSALRKYYNLR